MSCGCPSAARSISAAVAHASGDEDKLLHEDELEELEQGDAEQGRASALRAIHGDLESKLSVGSGRMGVMRRVVGVCMVCAAAAAFVSTSRLTWSKSLQGAADSQVTSLAEDISTSSDNIIDWGWWAIYIRSSDGLCLDSSGGRLHMEACEVDRHSQQWARSTSTGQLRNWDGPWTCLSEDHGHLYMWECNSSKAFQRWKFTDDSLSRVESHVGTCLTSKGQTGATLALGNCSNGTREEMWHLGAVTYAVGDVPAVMHLPSLFCWQVVNATEGSQELDLVREAYKRNTGVFGCNSWVIFSQQPGWVQQGVVKTSVLPGGLQPLWRQWAMGINWLMNSETFMEAWQKIHDDGRYKHHDWVVKLDPDAAFFADRLRQRLIPSTGQMTGAVYIRNCQPFNSMQGPLEVLSREAMTKLTTQMDVCRAAKDIQLGEDYFLEHCLMRLQVRGQNDWSLLHDRYCGPPLGPWRPMRCDLHKDVVALHPLKSTWEYLRCLKEVNPHMTDFTAPIS